MQLHEKAIMPKGFRCAARNCGLKPEGKDLSVFYSETPAAAAGVFTRNKFPGAPVILGREIIKAGILQAIVVNSKISNVGTGAQGIENARRMAAATAREFSLSVDHVIMSSTGVIAKQLDIERIEQGLCGIASELTDDPVVAAEGIMTTDTYPKAISVPVGDAIITAVGKGSGMIAPNMATMLVYIMTDADVTAPYLDTVLRDAVQVSFNMLSVDTDTSTSDTCIALANGLAGSVDQAHFVESVEFVCIEMAKLLARDGEGATKLLTANVSGASTDDEARIIAKSLVDSPLVKTMVYGCDPNIGRVLMAVGKCVTCEVIPEKIEIKINGKLLYKDLARVDFDEQDVRNLLGSESVDVAVNLNTGPASATAYGCDLTEGYIKENAAYYSS